MTSSTVIDDFMGAYSWAQGCLKILSQRAMELCHHGLRDSKPQVRYLLTSRVKSPESLREKLERLNDHYNDGKGFKNASDIWTNIYDIVGVRIALYIPNQVDQVEDIIGQTFDDVETVLHHPGLALQMEEERSSRDTRSEASPPSQIGAPNPQIAAGKEGRSDSGVPTYVNRFPGYNAKHFRVRFPKGDSSQKDNPSNIIFEIQVQSVLMHAWAEVEHDIQYKEKIEMPSVEEQRVLDCLNGLMMSSELLLQQLQSLHVTRVRTIENRFRNQYALGDFLHRQLAKSVNVDELENDTTIPGLRRFLEVLHIDTPQNLNPTLETLFLGESPEYPNIKEKFKPLVPSLSVCIMDHILSDLPEEKRLEAVMLAKQASCQDTYRLKVVISSLIWLYDLFEPFSALNDMFHEDNRTKEQNESLQWVFKGARRSWILLNQPASSDIEKDVSVVWDWFKDLHKLGEAFRFVFRISEMGVLRDLPKELLQLKRYESVLVGDDVEQHRSRSTQSNGIVSGVLGR